MNLYFSRKFTYSLYELDNVKFAQITRDNHECRNTLLFYWIVYNQEILS